MKVGIINYGLGNLKSLEMIIKNLGYDVEVIFSVSKSFFKFR